MAAIRAVPSRPGGHRRRRTTRSRSRRRTSPACCTWATRSTTRSRTAWPAITACAGGARNGSSAPTTPASPPRPRWSARSSPRGRSRARPRARGVRGARVGVAGAVRRDDHRAAQAPRGLRGLRRPSASRSTTTTSRRCSRSSCRSMRRATSTATATWSTGTRGPARRSPTWRSSSARSRTRCTTSTTRWTSGSGAITVATVRPETMLADSAIAVHPEDERYRRLIGEKAILPLVGRKLKIIADEYVQARLRHRRAEDHARPRPQRLRDRPPPRPGPAVGHRRGRPHHRRGPGALPRHDRRRGPAGRRGRAAPSRG